MGTRAGFWLGNPADVKKRKLLGHIAWDGYELDERAKEFDNIDKYLAFIETQKERDDFAPPEDGFPFPWADNIGLTDYNYTWLDGKLKVYCYGSDVDVKGEEEELTGVPAPSKYNPSQPDSIIILRG